MPNNFIKYDNQTNYDSIFCSTVGMNKEAINKLAVQLLAPDFIQSIKVLFNNVADWLSSLVWFPLSIFPDDPTLGTLTIVNYDTKLPAVRIKASNYMYDMGYINISSILPPNKYESYDDFSELSVYLPFLGEVNLSINKILSISDVVDNTYSPVYLLFRLALDSRTGSGVYYIFSTLDVPSQSGRFAKNDDTLNLNLVDTFNVQIGIQTPITASTLNETYRNLILSTVKMGVDMATLGATVLAPEAAFASTTVRNVTETTITKGRSKAAARAGERSRVLERKTREYSGETSTDASYAKRRAIESKGSETINSSLGLLDSVHYRSSTDKINNPYLYSLLNTKIIVRVREARINNINSTPNANAKIFGLPYGKFDTLNTVHGLTFITDIHLEDMGDTVTADELELIEENLKNGVILP